MKITLLVIGLVVLLGCGITGALVGPALYAMQQDSSTTLRMPATAGGLTKDTHNDAGAQLQSELEGIKGLTDPVSGVYQDPHDAARPVVALGATGTILFPGNSIDMFFTGMREQGSVTGKVTVRPPTSIGGTMTCALATEQGYRFGTCAWANHHALVGILCLSRSVDKAGTLIKRMLPDIVRKG